MKKIVLLLMIVSLFPAKGFSEELSEVECVALMIIPDFISMKSFDLPENATEEQRKKAQAEDERFSKIKMKVYKEGGCNSQFDRLKDLIKEKLNK